MHKYITYVADRAATREVEALADFYGLGRLVVSGELTYETARDDMVKAFSERGLQGSTAKVYVSQGYALSQLFDKFADLEDWADEECKGSRSLKRIYDAVKAPATPATPATPAVKTPLVDVILANLANLTDAAEIARVRDACEQMLTVKAAA